MITSRNSIRTAAVGIALAGATVLGATGVANAAASDTDADSDASVGIVAQVDGETPTDEERQERREERREARQASRVEVAELFGLDVEDLGEQLLNGETLADVAAAQGVEVSAVVDLIVEQKAERIDVAVENGRLTQDEADEKVAELPERVQTRVEEGRPERGERGDRGDRGNRGPRGDRGQNAEAPAADG